MSAGSSADPDRAPDPDPDRAPDPDCGSSSDPDAAAAAPDAQPVGTSSPPRSRPRDPLAFVVATAAIGVLIAALHHPRTGMFVVCGALAAGGLLRLLLSPRNAGLLVVRKRRVDVVVLLGLALALGVLAAVTPFPAGQG
jgi:hypothetical protein